jgi:hypothetical protein
LPKGFFAPETKRHLLSMHFDQLFSHLVYRKLKFRMLKSFQFILNRDGLELHNQTTKGSCNAYSQTLTSLSQFLNSRFIKTSINQSPDETNPQAMVQEFRWRWVTKTRAERQNLHSGANLFLEGKC